MCVCVCVCVRIHLRIIILTSIILHAMVSFPSAAVTSVCIFANTRIFART